MSFSNSKSFMVRSICTALIAAMLLALLPITAFASAKNENKKPSEETMKSLAQKYLNERNRMLVSSDPDSNDMLNVPMLEPGEMSQQLAARQRDDVEKIRSLTKNVENLGCYYWNRFETKVEIENTTVAPHKTVARISEYTRLYFTPEHVRPGSEYSSFGGECDFTFVRNGAKWIISDVTVPNPGTMPPPNQPSAEPMTPSPKDYIPLNTGPSKKKIGIAAFTIAALGLLTLVGVLVAVRITHKPKVTITRRPKVTISADDLAEMKTLAYKYLNERIRMLISSNPDNDQNIAGAPTISPSEMSPELAKRQMEDVEKLKAQTHLGTFKNFAILSHVLNVQEAGDNVVLHLGESTYFQLSQPGGPPCCSAGDDYYFTFSRVGGRWILKDVKLTYSATMPSDIEPSVESYEEGTDRVLANPPKETSVILEEIKKLDTEAIEKIKNRWAIDDQTAEAIKSGTYSW